MGSGFRVPGIVGATIVVARQNGPAQLKSVIEMDGPVLCEIMGLENQGYIRLSHARDSNRRHVVRPLENQAPYLNRELFLSEMIIDPIDQ